MRLRQKVALSIIPNIYLSAISRNKNLIPNYHNRHISLSAAIVAQGVSSTCLHPFINESEKSWFYGQK